MGVPGAVDLEDQTAGLCADCQDASAFWWWSWLLSASFELQPSNWSWAY